MSGLSTGRYGRVNPGQGYGQQYDYTADTVLTEDQDGALVTNLGATAAVEITLPPAVAGAEFAVMRIAVYSITVTASGTDDISEGPEGGSYVINDRALIVFSSIVDGTWEVVLRRKTIRTYNVLDYGATGDGVTDDTSGFSLAMAAGGKIDIPIGTYLLNDCEIPVDVGAITLNPLGPVTIKWNGTASYGALLFRPIVQSTNIGSVVAVTTLTRAYLDYPGTSDQAVTKLEGAAGAFSAFLPDEKIFLQSDLTDEAGFIKAEWGAVLDTAAAGATMYLSRPVNFDYTGFTTLNVRRILSEPKLTIKRGITFSPNTDYTATGIDRRYGLFLEGAINPDIDVEFIGAYDIAVICYGIFKGSLNVVVKDLHVDYSDNAFGYGVSFYGACYQSNVRVDGQTCGHLITQNGDGTTYSDSAWARRGVPTEMDFRSLVTSNARRAAWDSHWSYRSRTHYLSVSGSAMDADENNNNTQAFAGVAVDPWFGTVIARDVYRAGYLQASLGVASTWQIDNLTYDNPFAPLSRPIIGYDIDAASTQTKFIVNGGSARLGAAYFLDSAVNSTDNGPVQVYRNFSFHGGYALGRVLYDNNARWFLENCTWWPDGTNTINACFRVDAVAPNTQVIIDGLRIMQDANDNPDGLFRLVTDNTYTVSVLVNDVVCVLNNATSLARYSSDSAGGGVVAAITTNRIDDGVALTSGTTGGTGSAGAGNTYVEINVNGTNYKVLHDGTV
jgi:hypothetical protein